MKARIYTAFFSLIFLLSTCSYPVSIEPLFLADEIEVKTVTYGTAPAINPIHFWEEKFGTYAITHTTSIIIDRIASVSGLDLSIPEQSLKADLYLPPSYPKNKLPCLIFAHGGAFIKGNRTDISDLCKHFATYNMIVVSIDYRLMSLLAPSYLNASYIAMLDMLEAISFISTQVDNYNIDKKSIYLGGYSAGSVVAIHTAFYNSQSAQSSIFDQSEKLFGAGANHSIRVKGVINIGGGIYDLDLIEEDIPVISFHCPDDIHVPYDCGLPFPNYTKEVNRKLQKAKSYIRYIPKLEQLLEEAKLVEICGSQEIDIRLKKRKIPSKLVGICKSDILAQNGKLTNAGHQMVHESISFIRQNY
jgi:poly(3-hydroxybutyrate) depolymerase